MDIEASHKAARTQRELSTAFFAAQVLLTVIAFAHTLLSTLSVASCTASSCDYAAFSSAINTSYLGTSVLLISTVLAMLLLRRYDRATLSAPITGIVLLLLLQAFTYAAGRAALTLPLFGNRLPGCC